MDWLMDMTEKYVMPPILVLFISALAIGLFVGIPYGLYKWATYTPPETFELRVDSWRCTKSHQRDVESCSAKTGCSWRRVTICDEYTRL